MVKATKEARSAWMGFSRSSRLAGSSCHGASGQTQGARGKLARLYMPRVELGRSINTTARHRFLIHPSRSGVPTIRNPAFV
jgi:hypothetical protein